MSWLILFAHSFNPVLLVIGLYNQHDGEDFEINRSPEKVFAIILTSFFAYLLWLFVHFVVLKIVGTGLDYHEFIGVGEGVAYFLPFMIGVGLLFSVIIIEPKLRTETHLVLFRFFRNVLVFFSSYFMLVNYMAWIIK